MKLTIVGLPIGNVEDISLRAIRALQETNFLICEDTRMFNNLWCKLMQMGLAEKFTGKIRFINDYNEKTILPRILAEVCSLNSAVLVSDAGMPLISDPGYKLVKRAIELDWEIEVVPGPTAESAALAVSGLPTDRYLFLGFLPKKSGGRLRTLNEVLEVGKLAKTTVVIYESSLRLFKILPEIVEVLGGETPACLAVDLTKVSEKVIRGSLAEINETLKNTRVKGELVLLVSVGK